MQSELDSFLIQISAEILAFKDPNGEGYLVDKILDKTGMKGTGADICPFPAIPWPRMGLSPVALMQCAISPPSFV